MECSINSPALSLLMKHLVIGQRLKTSNFSAFHWSPRGNLVSIGRLFCSHKGSTFTEKDRNKLNYRIRTKADLITSYCSYARPAQPGLSDQAMPAMHSCISWLICQCVLIMLMIGE